MKYLNGELKAENTQFSVINDNITKNPYSSINRKKSSKAIRALH